MTIPAMMPSRPLMIRQLRPCFGENAATNVMIPWTRNRMPMTKMNTSTDWNGARSKAKPTMTDRTPMIAWSTRAPVSPSRVKDVITSKKPLDE